MKIHPANILRTGLSVLLSTVLASISFGATSPTTIVSDNFSTAASPLNGKVTTVGNATWVSTTSGTVPYVSGNAIKVNSSTASFLGKVPVPAGSKTITVQGRAIPVKGTANTWIGICLGNSLTMTNPIWNDGLHLIVNSAGTAQAFYRQPGTNDWALEYLYSAVANPNYVSGTPVLLTMTYYVESNTVDMWVDGTQVVNRYALGAKLYAKTGAPNGYAPFAPDVSYAGFSGMPGIKENVALLKDFSVTGSAFYSYVPTVLGGDNFKITANRTVGSSLHGQTTEAGGTAWHTRVFSAEGTSNLQVGDFYGNPVNDAANREIGSGTLHKTNGKVQCKVKDATFVGKIPTTYDLSASNGLGVEADVTPVKGASGSWVGIGFGNPGVDSTLYSGGFTLILNDTGSWTLFEGSTSRGGGSVINYTTGKTCHLALEYDRPNNVVYAWVNGIRVKDVTPAAAPDVTYAGFSGYGNDKDKGLVDNFRATANPYFLDQTFRGVNYPMAAKWNGIWNTTYAEGWFKELTNQGTLSVKYNAANVVRIWVTANQYLDSIGTTSPTQADIDAALTTVIAETKGVLAMAKKYRVKAIVVYGGSITTQARDASATWADTAFQNKFVSKWKEIATAFKSYTADGTIIGYDLMNEPALSGATATNAINIRGGDGESIYWRPLAIRAIKEISTIDPIVGGNDFSFIYEDGNYADGFFTQTAPLPFSNVLYGFHYYYPHDFTHQGVYSTGTLTNGAWVISGTNSGSYNANSGTGTFYPGNVTVSGDSSTIGNWNMATLDSYMQRALDFQTKYGVPMYIGEFDAVRWAPLFANGDSSAALWMKDVVNLMEGHGWHWTYLDFRSWVGWYVNMPEGHDKIWASGMPYPAELPITTITKRKQTILDALKANPPLPAPLP